MPGHLADEGRRPGRDEKEHGQSRVKARGMMAQDIADRTKERMANRA